MSQFITLFNDYLAKVKPVIVDLFETTKSQLLKETSKSMTSYMELTNVFPKRDTMEDDFQDLSKVELDENMIIDKDGYTLGYTIDEVAFEDSVYTTNTYSMVMNNGEIIPGSKFSNIFNDSIGFWGYQSDMVTQAYFSINLKSKSTINKVYLETNNFMPVTLFIKEDFDTEWIEIGIRNDNHHMWNFAPLSCVALRFQSDTSLFSVSRLKVGMAKYKRFGTFLSKAYDVDDLYRLKLIADQDVPNNTNISYSILVSGQVEEYPIIDESIISGGVVWHTASGTIDELTLPSGYIDDSLNIKVGYRTWDIVDEYDYSWITEEYSPNVSGVIDIVSDYILLDECVQQIKLGNTVFVKGSDYSVDYSDISIRRIRIILLEGTKIPVAEFANVKCSVLAKNMVRVRQMRAYVELDKDEDIIIEGFAATPSEEDFTIRHLVLKDEIVRDVTQGFNHLNRDILLERVDGGEWLFQYRVKGQEGINLIEFEPRSACEFPLDLNIKWLDYYSKRYTLIQVTSDPDETEYVIDPILDVSGVVQAYELDSEASGVLYAEYAESVVGPSGLLDTEIQLKAVLTSTDGQNTPTLRSYLLENLPK